MSPRPGKRSGPHRPQTATATSLKPASTEPGAAQVLATGVRMGMRAMRNLIVAGIVLLIVVVTGTSIYMELF